MIIIFQEKPIYIADTLHNTIQMSELEKRIVSTELFNRLHTVSQNSTAYLTFPTNRTKRFEHSVGTMKLCGEIFFYGISNTEKDTLNLFFKSLKDNIKEVFINKDIKSYRHLFEDKERDLFEKYKDIHIESCFYNNYVPSNINEEDKFLYLMTFQAVRIAALLHDIGHPPFSHITENAIKKAFKETKAIEQQNERQVLFVKIIETYCKEDTVDKKYQLHEELGNVMVERILDNLIRENSKADFSSKYFIILTSQVAMYMLNEQNSFFKQLHKIIDGIIDGDRLDYVSRDAINSGFESGRIEYSRLISSMKLCYDKKEYIFAPDIKVLNTTEDFFFRRWKLYKTIVYHHRVIKTDYLLGDSIYQMIVKYLDDTSSENEMVNCILPNDISGLWKPLSSLVQEGSNQKCFDALIQWDDGWLLSILKQYYLSEEYSNNTDLKYELEELLSNKKQFYSIIKDTNDFNRLDQVIINNIQVDFDKIKESYIGMDKTYMSPHERLEKICKSRGVLRYGYFLFNMKALIENFFDDQYNFRELIREMVDDLIKEKYSDKIAGHFIEFKEPNYGLSKLPSIVKNKDIVALDKISNIRDLMQYDGRTFPVFFLYIRKTQESEFNYDDFISDLGKEIAVQWNKFFASIVD